MRLPEISSILDFLTPHRLFARLPIASKMLMGYSTLVVMTVVVVVYVLLSLQRLNSLNRNIVMVDIPVQEAADTMIDAMLAQDMYEKRYLILSGDDMRGLFTKRGKEFSGALASLRQRPETTGRRIEIIGRLYESYSALFQREVRLIRAGKPDVAAALSNGEMKRTFEKLVAEIHALSTEAKKSQEMKMDRISRIGTTAFFTTAGLCILGIVLGGLSSMVVMRHVLSSINKLTVATTHIAEGDFRYDPRIETRDEVGGLAESFLSMGQRLGKLEEMYLDASPLTRLPGGIAIENVLKRRIGSGDFFAFCVIDLDNFKAFNDHYGYAHGNEVIRDTAKLIETAVKAKGSPEDFVGHVGGDDFVVITTPKLMREVCNEIIRLFDAGIPLYYSEQDRQNGFIIGKSRQGEEMRFPLMTLSIAIVTNEQRRFVDPLEASEIAAELKDYAKTIPSSLYVVDKRRTG